MRKSSINRNFIIYGKLVKKNENTSSKITSFGVDLANFFISEKVAIELSKSKLTKERLRVLLFRYKDKIPTIIENGEKLICLRSLFSYFAANFK